MTVYKKFEISEKNARKIFEKHLAEKAIDLTKGSVNSLLELNKTNYIKVEKEEREKNVSEEEIKKAVNISKFNFYISNGKFSQEIKSTEGDEQLTKSIVIPILKVGDYRNNGLFEEGFESLLYQVLTNKVERKKEVYYTFYTTDSKESIKEIFGSKAYIEDVVLDDDSIQVNEIKEKINWKHIIKEQSNLGATQSVTWGKTEIEKQRDNTIARYLRGNLTEEDLLYLKNLKTNDVEAYEDILVDMLFAPKKEDDKEDVLRLRTLKMATSLEKVMNDYHNSLDKFIAPWNGNDSSRKFNQIAIDLISLDFKFMLKKIKAAKAKNEKFYEEDFDGGDLNFKYKWDAVLDIYLKTLAIIPIFSEKESMEFLSLKRYGEKDTSILMGDLKRETSSLLLEMDYEIVSRNNTKASVEKNDSSNANNANEKIVKEKTVLLDGENIVANIKIEELSAEQWKDVSGRELESFNALTPKKVEINMVNKYLQQFPHIKELKSLIQDIIVNSPLYDKYIGNYDVRDNLKEKVKSRGFMLPFESLTDNDKLNFAIKVILSNGLTEDNYDNANKAVNYFRNNPIMQEKLIKISDLFAITRGRGSFTPLSAWDSFKSIRNLMLKKPESGDLLLYKISGLAKVKSLSSLEDNLIGLGEIDGNYDFYEYIENNNIFMNGLKELKELYGNNGNYHTLLSKRDKRELIIDEFGERNVHIIDAHRQLTKLLKAEQDETKKAILNEKIENLYKWSYKIIDELINIKEEEGQKGTWTLRNLLSEQVNQLMYSYAKDLDVPMKIMNDLMVFKDEDEFNKKRTMVNEIIQGHYILRTISRFILVDNGYTENVIPSIGDLGSVENEWGQLLSKKVPWNQNDLEIMTRILSCLNKPESDKYKVILTQEILANFAIKTVALATTNVNSSPEKLKIIKEFLEINFKNKEFYEKFFKMFKFSDGRSKKKVKDVFESVGLSEIVEQFILENKSLQEAVSLLGNTDKLYNYYKEPTRLRELKKELRVADSINSDDIQYTERTTINTNNMILLKGMGLIDDEELRNAQRIHALEMGQFHYSAISPIEKHNRIVLDERLDDVKDILLTHKMKQERCLGFLTHTLRQFSSDLLEEDQLIERVAYLLDVIQNMNPSINIFEKNRINILEIYKLFGKEKSAVLSNITDVSGDSLGVALNKVRFSNMLSEDVKVVKKRKI